MANTNEATSNKKQAFKENIQRFGRSLLLPIGVMAPVGLLLGLSGALTQSYMKSVMLVMTYQQGKIFVFYLKVSFHLKLHWYLLNKKII